MPVGLERISGPHVYIEGTDLSGKDTVGLHVQEEMQYPVMHRLFLLENNPYEALLARLNKEQQPFFGSVIARSLLYEIQHLSLKEPTLMLSSHVLRATAVQRGFQEPLADVLEDIAQFYPQFDAVVLLTASLEAKRERLKGRTEQATAWDNRVNTDPEFVLRMDTAITELATNVMNATVIDTTPLTIEESKHAALQAIRDALTAPQKRKPRSVYPDLNYITAELDTYDDFVRRKYKVTI